MNLQLSLTKVFALATCLTLLAGCSAGSTPRTTGNPGDGTASGSPAVQAPGTRSPVSGARRIRLVGTGTAPSLQSYSGGVAQIFATAPPGIGREQLGMPLGRRFQPMAGAGASSLFPSGQVQEIPQHTVEQEVYRATTRVQLEANVSAWGLGGLNAGGSDTERFASYRARIINRAFQVDDRTAMRAPPPGAFFYLAKVYYGHTFEAVFHADENTFHAGVAADLEIVNVDIQTFASQNRLRYEIRGKGLKPKTVNALLARTERDITENYTIEYEAPIFVEYRTIPGMRLDDAEIGWVSDYRDRLIDRDLYMGAMVELQGGLLLRCAGFAVERDPANRTSSGVKTRRKSGPDWRATVDSRTFGVEVKSLHQSDEAIAHDAVRIAILLELEEHFPHGLPGLEIEIDAEMLARLSRGRWVNQPLIEELVLEAVIQFEDRGEATTPLGSMRPTARAPGMISINGLRQSDEREGNRVRDELRSDRASGFPRLGRPWTAPAARVVLLSSLPNISGGAEPFTLAIPRQVPAEVLRTRTFDG